MSSWLDTRAWGALGRALGAMGLALALCACGGGSLKEGDEDGGAGDGGAQGEDGGTDSLDGGDPGGPDAGSPELTEGMPCGAPVSDLPCAEGLDCKGSPATCQVSEAPVLSMARFLREPARVSFAGTDGDGDIVSYTIDFLDDADDPIGVDIDHDEDTPPVGSIYDEVPRTAALDLTVTLPLDAQLLAEVERLRITLRDTANRESNSIVVDVEHAASGMDASMDAATADASMDAGTRPDAALDGGLQTSDGGMGGDAASADAAADAARYAPPTLTTALVRQTGRSGADLRVDVTGSDPDGDALEVRLALFDAMDAGVAIQETIADGGIAPLTADIPLAPPLGAQPGATGNALLPGFYRDHPSVRRAEVTLLDARRLASSTLRVAVTTQPVVALGGACDSAQLSNRCAPTLACRGTPPTCQEGSAPEITKAGYYQDELGTRILVASTDPDEDVASCTVTFLDSGGAPTLVDLDGLGDDSPVSSITLPTTAIPSSGKYLLRFDVVSAFAEQVGRVALVVNDAAGHRSAPVEATLAAAPLRMAGESCDPRGFERCPTGGACAPAASDPSTGTCVDMTTARSAACTVALTLEPLAGSTTLRSRIKAPSLWDPPSGCSSGDPEGMPEAVVKVVLGRPVRRLVLSTDHAFTSFDTTLYALESCTAEPRIAWCNDDQVAAVARPQLAVLTLSDLPAGTYYVVVDSFSQEAGTTFELSAVATE